MHLASNMSGRLCRTMTVQLGAAISSNTQVLSAELELELQWVVALLDRKPWKVVSLVPQKRSAVFISDAAEECEDRQVASCTMCRSFARAKRRGGKFVVCLEHFSSGVVSSRPTLPLQSFWRHVHRFSCILRPFTPCQSRRTSIQ